MIRVEYRARGRLSGTPRRRLTAKVVDGLETYPAIPMKLGLPIFFKMESEEASQDAALQSAPSCLFTKVFSNLQALPRQAASSGPGQMG